MKNESRRVTIKDVARETGFSIATVSRVINGVNMYYSEETRRKVEEAVQKLNYTPNLNAKGLKESRTFNIAYMVPQIDDFYVEVYDAMQEVANEKGYTIVILSSNYKEEQERINVNHIREKQYDGVVISTGLMNKDYRLHMEQLFPGIPVVFCEGMKERQNIHTVKVDVEAVCKEATEYLLAEGHKKIAYVSAPCRFETLTYRFKGYQDALQGQGMQLEKELIFFEKGLEKTNYNNCYKVMKNIISKRTFTAMLVMSDWAAFCALKVANELGLKVPADLSIIGFDNLPFTEYSQPQLTTISQNSRWIGGKSIHMILNCLEGKKVKDVMRKGELVKRGSVDTRR